VKPWDEPRIQCGTIGREMIQQCPLGQTQTSGRIRAWSVLPRTTAIMDFTKARNPNRPSLLFDSTFISEVDRKRFPQAIGVPR